MDNQPDNDTWNRWKNDPNNWKWGIFYYNPEDKRLLVLKRHEWMGMTFNFAHPMAPLVTGLLLLWIVSMAMVPLIAR